VCGQDLLALSVGAAFYPQNGSDAEQLLAEADRKMYAAKQLRHEPPESASLRVDQRSRSASVN